MFSNFLRRPALAIVISIVILFLEELSYEQIAEATGMSANHVGVMLHRAKKRLSGLMTEGGAQ